MILVADESVDRQIVERLRQDGHVVDYVAEMDPGVADATVLSFAILRKGIVLTAETRSPPNSAHPAALSLAAGAAGVQGHAASPAPWRR